MADLTGVAIGDTLMMLNTYSRSAAQEVTVTKVARLKLTVLRDGYEEIQFYRDSGQERRHDSRRHVLTIGQFTERQDRRDLFLWLNGAGVTVPRDMPAATLRRIKEAILEGEAT